MRRTAAVAAGLATVLLTSACDLSQLGNLEFTRDTRLDFSTPSPRALVTLPLTVSWTMKNFTASGADGSTSKTAGEYAVFVDSAPIAVGKNLQSIGSGDASCQNVKDCVTPAYLLAKDVYVTAKPTVTLTKLPKPSNSAGDEQHEVTVVLLDGTGTRRVESAWHVDFRFPRRASL